ncbi:hypothetical protein BN7_2445 [Wickerhamomyces ciferrii]|uniref:Uncharacterized protein n=1 Tax=Wickerhamomyces ciferrii (strain ATCC 14091 / BCRC 22168 / CBS 111 / JCM 3599 / NBRC 0793 / NRRL Y-1031 F-60-10) TaxID=1206466 RepID=K0KND7_WICCF|nr:uncharacterized protein BN7_2445 [Wickerhamomyces ciferrii]CCH42899.1 hypothetical protein BN7_2445 [Wickerhamomyces ciferrii]
MSSGKLHKYNDNLVAFEFNSTTPNPTDNAIIFIGGLGDGLLTVPYLSKLNESLPTNWSLFQILISSSYQGWGTGSLDRDIKEIKQFVDYLHGLGKQKVVLFGHSTGTQDSIHYALQNQGQGIDGIILQAPVSDREAIVKSSKEDGLDLDSYNKEAQEFFDKQGPQAVLPKKFSDFLFGVSAISSYRWLSLTLENGDDDYFSTDLSDEKLQETFGKLNKPTLVLYSGEDQFFPDGVDIGKVLQRWESFTKPGVWSKYSLVIDGATHNIGEGSKEGSVDVLIKQVQSFINEL